MSLYACKNWDDINFNMQQLAEARLKLSTITVEEETKINVVKKEYQFEISALNEKIEKVEEEIKIFAKANIKDFGDKRSKKVNFGKISLTKSNKVFISSDEVTLAKIKELGLNDCWKNKEEIIKNNLKNLDVKSLAKIGATIIEEDNIKIETSSKK